jgi:hypothetical protein
MTSFERGLGVATRSLVLDNTPAPLGYFAMAVGRADLQLPRGAGRAPQAAADEGRCSMNLRPYGPPDDAGTEPTEPPE